MLRKSFASDNNSGIHPLVLEAIQAANVGDAVGYGDDQYTKVATAQFQQLFGDDAEVFFVFNGTGANVLALSSLIDAYQAVICAAGSHINVDECGAPERFIGCKLIDVPTSNGKLTPALIQPHLHGFGVQHHVQPKVISITQSSEVGTVYTVAEIRALADLAHAHGMYLHMDGARISNAAATLGVPFRTFTRDAGVDALSFGGTKNGLMIGEAVLLFAPTLKERAMFLRKQEMQLASKMRFIAAQFSALLTDDLWLKNAGHANRMAAILAEQVREIPNITLTQTVQVNSVFAIVPREIIPLLMEQYFFYVWDEERDEVRWMTSFNTTEADIAQFVAALRAAIDTVAIQSSVSTG
jgi:threonine aldolase